jgi:uncharacterized OB-fold protein
MSYPKPVPVLDVETRPFWEACQRGRLTLQRCSDCGHIRFPPTRFCAKCRSVKCEWIESKGRGRVFSWIVVRHPVPRDVYAQDVPYVVALIALDEGVRIPSNIIDCKPEDVSAGMPVSVVFRAVTPDVTLPLFQPVTKST